MSKALKIKIDLNRNLMNIVDKDILNTHLIAQSVKVEQQSNDLIKECFRVREES